MRAMQVIIWIGFKPSDQNSTVNFASTSWGTVTTSNILCRNPAVTISVLMTHENSGAHRELRQQRRNWLRCFWRQNLYHLVHVQVRRGSRCQIFCPETPLGIFRYEHPVKKKHGPHLEPWQQWKSWLRLFWRTKLYRLGHVQVQRRSPCQICCP